MVLGMVNIIDRYVLWIQMKQVLRTYGQALCGNKQEKEKEILKKLLQSMDILLFLPVSLNQR